MGFYGPRATCLYKLYQKESANWEGPKGGRKCPINFQLTKLAKFFGQTALRNERPVFQGNQPLGEWASLTLLEEKPYSVKVQGRAELCLFQWATLLFFSAAAVATKSLQLCLTLCNPTDGNPPGSSIPEILQARILEWVAISFSNACMHAKMLQSCPTLQPHG